MRCPTIVLCTWNLNNMQTWTMVFREVDKDRFEEMMERKRHGLYDGRLKSIQIRTDDYSKSFIRLIARSTVAATKSFRASPNTGNAASTDALFVGSKSTFPPL